MPIYQTKGHLTGTIEPENVAAAQAYLREDHDGRPINMQQYLDPWAKDVVLSLVWTLMGDGRTYIIEAVALRDLTDDELKQLSSECSGQNSDGLGEGFEQQDFAWNAEPDEWNPDDEDDESPYGEEGHMCSFDWETNELPWEKVG